MSLPFGPLPSKTWLVCVDMQRIFLEPGDWYCPAGLELLPITIALHDAAPSRTLYTRFISALSPAAASGSWRRYYERWRSVTLDEAGEEMMALHEELLALADPSHVFDKYHYDSFRSSSFSDFIDKAKPDALVVYGIETDVCVLATVISAVERGIRTLVPLDAVASGDANGHRAALDHIFPRFDQQVELVEAAAVIDALESQ